LRRLLVLGVLTLSTVLLGSCNRAVESVGCDKPLAHWLKPSDGIGHLLPYNRVVVDSDGVIRWNGVPISNAMIAGLMEAAGEMEPAPQLILQVSPKANCEVVNFVRKTMDKAPICKNLKLCGEGRGWVLNGDRGAQSTMPAGF
jgi:hypothetical protein